MQVKNYILGEWVSGKGEEINHFHSIDLPTLDLINLVF